MKHQYMNFNCFLYLRKYLIILRVSESIQNASPNHEEESQNMWNLHKS